MTEEIFLIADLIVKQMRGELSEGEKEMLDKWLASPENRNLLAKLSGGTNLNDRLVSMHDIDNDAWKKKAYEILFPGIVPMGNRKKLNWKRYLVAASFFLVVMVGVFWATGLFRKDGQETKLKSVVEQNEILPGSDKAVLKLANGTTINLIKDDDRSLTEKNGTLIRNSKGELVYDAAKVAGDETVYNLLSTARGGKYSITLADGSKVWLNAASTVYYPTAFPGKERKVEITGEAYFEVAKDNNKPFIVKVGEMEVEVLGTEFNINAYADENVITTTLVSGAVKLENGSSKINMQAGQQAQVAGHKLDLVREPNIAQAIAWRNGMIALGGNDLKAVFRQISRWYDVDVEFQGQIKPLQLFGDIPRSINLEAVIKALEENSGIRCEIVGKKVIVRPG